MKEPIKKESLHPLIKLQAEGKWPLDGRVCYSLLPPQLSEQPGFHPVLYHEAGPLPERRTEALMSTGSSVGGMALHLASKIMSHLMQCVIRPCFSSHSQTQSVRLLVLVDLRQTQSFLLLSCRFLLLNHPGKLSHSLVSFTISWSFPILQILTHVLQLLLITVISKDSIEGVCFLAHKRMSPDLGPIFQPSNSGLQIIIITKTLFFFLA